MYKYESHIRMILIVFSLDKELVRMVEERKAREREEAEIAKATAAAATKNKIQVKPIIETVCQDTPASTTITTPAAKTNTNDKTEDLLR